MKIEPPTTQCRTCPFRSDGGLKLHPDHLAEIYGYLLEGSNHFCHSVRTKNQVCWGGRQWQLEMFYRLGRISAPTNEALADAMRQAGVAPKKHVDFG